METVTEKKYICEYCRSEYSSMRAALNCLAKCRLRSVSRLQWYDKHKPKYKVGDFVYTQSRLFPYRVVGYLRCMGKVNPYYCYKIIPSDYLEPFNRDLEELSLCMSKLVFLKCCGMILKGLPCGSLYTIWPATRRMTLRSQSRVLSIRLRLPIK